MCRSRRISQSIGVSRKRRVKRYDKGLFFHVNLTSITLVEEDRQQLSTQETLMTQQGVFRKMEKCQFLQAGNMQIQRTEMLIILN